MNNFFGYCLVAVCMSSHKNFNIFINTHQQKCKEEKKLIFSWFIRSQVQSIITQV